MNRGEAIVLLGMMGVGKSTVGRLLSARTDLPLYDTDEMVAASLGLSISEIFSQRGEATFRDAETEALFQVPRVPAVVATGGGMVLRCANVQRMRELGSTVFLIADEGTLLLRLSRRGLRPLLQTESPDAALRDLLRVREPLYQTAADLTIDTSALTLEQVAEAVLKQVKCALPSSL